MCGDMWLATHTLLRALWFCRSSSSGVFLLPNSLSILTTACPPQLLPLPARNERPTHSVLCVRECRRVMYHMTIMSCLSA